MLATGGNLGSHLTMSACLLKSIAMSTIGPARFRKLIRDALVWGVALWLIGYVLGIIFFFVLPTPVIGWIIMPIGGLITFWVLLTRINYRSVWSYAMLSAFWTAVAIGLDYVFIVKLLSPEDGYYKLDVYLYYVLTFLMPLAVGWWRASRSLSTRVTGWIQAGDL